MQIIFQSLEFEGYRGYKNATNVQFRPITLLYGENSAGKSTILRMLPLLRRTIEAYDCSAPLRLDSQITKSATFKDLYCKYSDSPIIKIALEFDVGDSKTTTVQYTIRQFEETAIVFAFSFSDTNGTHALELNLSGDNPLSEESRRYQDVATRQDVGQIHFSGLRPNTIEVASTKWTTICSTVNKCLGTLSQSRWLGPLRKGIPRFEAVDSSIQDVGQDGSGAPQILYGNISGLNKTRDEVASWYKEYAGVTLHISPGAHDFGAIAGLALIKSNNSLVRIPFEDVGEGMSQILPVLVLASMASQGILGFQPVISIEHPDLHLHSNAHYGIIEFLVACTKGPGQPRFVIESHSETILTAAQLEILKGNLSAKDYISYYVSSDESGVSKISAAELDDSAKPLNDIQATEDWFSVTHSKAMELAKRKILGS